MNPAVPLVLALVLSGVAVSGLTRRGGRSLRKLQPVRDVPPPTSPAGWARGRREPGWRGVLRGRLDAPPVWRRVLVSLPAAVVLALTLVSWAGLASEVGWLLAGLIGTGGTVVVGLLEPAASRRREHRLLLDTPQALDLLAGCLAAGLPPRNATAAVVSVLEGPVADDLRSVLLAIEVGMSDAMAWRSLRGHPQLGEAAVDLARSVESGTRMVETLTYYAREARQRRAAVIEVAARSVGVRCVLPMMTCFIPAFVLLGIVPTVVSAFLAAMPRLL